MQLFFGPVLFTTLRLDHIGHCTLEGAAFRQLNCFGLPPFSLGWRCSELVLGFRRSVVDGGARSTRAGGVLPTRDEPRAGFSQALQDARYSGTHASGSSRDFRAPRRPSSRLRIECPWPPQRAQCAEEAKIPQGGGLRSALTPTFA